jgi:hypothetical protein
MWKLVETEPHKPALKNSNRHNRKINKSIAAFPLDRKRCKQSAVKPENKAQH